MLFLGKFMNKGSDARTGFKTNIIGKQDVLQAGDC